MFLNINAYSILARMREGKEPLGRPIYRWQNNMKIIKTEWGGKDWIYLTQNVHQWRALVNTVMNLWSPQNAGKFSGSLCDWQLLNGVRANYSFLHSASNAHLSFKFSSKAPTNYHKCFSVNFKQHSYST
jgi:hypothetical protein